MNKWIIFNVGWAMASYWEIDWKKIIIDLWKSDEFSPVKDFLLDYAEKNNWGEENWKYKIDQLIISHPHKDHLSDIKEFDKYFYADLVTTPNDNEWMWKEESINWDLVLWDEPDKDVLFLKNNVIKDRQPPLRSCTKFLELYYIKPKIIEEEITPKSDYVNNTSLVVILNINWQKIMLPWDIMSSWMDYMLNNDIVNIVPSTETKIKIKNSIKSINILVAPHHWLKSAFNKDAMDLMKDRLDVVIIPEKPTSEDSVRQVHDSYYNWDYWNWIDVFYYEDRKEKNEKTIKTSRWHLIIKWNNIIKLKKKENIVEAFN